MPAQTEAGRDAPVRTIIRQNREEGVEPLRPVEIPTSAVVWLLAAAVFFGLAALVIRRRTRRVAAPALSAERRLVRLRGLSRAADTLLTDLARATGIPRLAMLTSDTALRDALRHPDAATLRQRQGWARLELVSADGEGFAG